jgi:flagellar biogenesis protein FliO
MHFRLVHVITTLPMTLVHMPAAAQVLAQGNGVDVSIWRVVISLLFCLGLAAGAIFAVRRKFPASTLFNRVGSGRLKLVDQISLGPQRGVYLIKLDDREYLALFSQQGASLVPTDGSTAVTVENL